MSLENSKSKKTSMPNCAIIIPCKTLDKETRLCIEKCQKQIKIKIKIYIVSDKKVIPSKRKKNIKYLSYGPINMSEKRNRAISFGKEKYIAFIDSDAYPVSSWLINGINILKKNNKIGIVSGPDFPFPNQKGWQKLVGIAHKSFWLSGSKTFRKNIKKSFYCKQVSSCNMIMKRSIFHEVGGMNNKIYIGEDADFCNKVRKFYKICHSPKVKIFHKSRNFLPFLAQRYAYGTCILDVFGHVNFFQNFQYIVPLCITLFFFSFPIIFIFQIYKYIYTFVFLTLFFGLLVEAFKVTNKLLNAFKILLIFYLGIIFFGMGSLMRILGIKKYLKKIYTFTN